MQTNDDEESKQFNRKFKRAIIVFAVVEFVVIVLVMVYMVKRS
jgi:hypothetical protein